MKTIKQLLETKEEQIWSIQPNATVYDAVQLMAEKDLGALIVIENDVLCGLISERDYARKIILKDRNSHDTTVSDIMSTKIITATIDHRIDQCMAIMTEKRFRHLPIMDGEKLVGVVSIGDLVKSVIEDQKFMIDQLEQYISS